jgi:hypothetical protein
MIPRPTGTRGLIHNMRGLSTEVVDKSANLWIISGVFIHIRR